MEAAFVCCPLCGGKTRVKLLAETVLQNFLLFCPKCRRETVISAECWRITVVQGMNCGGIPNEIGRIRLACG